MPTCSEGNHVNDDNPGKPTCVTCTEWLAPAPAAPLFTDSGKPVPYPGGNAR